MGCKVTFPVYTNGVVTQRKFHKILTGAIRERVFDYGTLRHIPALADFQANVRNPVTGNSVGNPSSQISGFVAVFATFHHQRRFQIYKLAFAYGLQCIEGDKTVLRNSNQNSSAFLHVYRVLAPGI